MVSLVSVGFQEWASGQANSGSLQNPTDANIANMVYTVQGWNGTDWTAATLALTPTTHEFTATFAAGFKVQKIMIFTANDSFNTKALLISSLIFQNIKVTTTNMNMTYLFAYIAGYTNSSATTHIGDKSLKNIDQNISIYSNTTNKIGKDVEYNVPYMFGATSLTKTWNQYQMVVKSNVNSTTAASFTFIQIQEQPFGMNLFDTVAWFAAVFGLFEAVFLYQSIPRRYGYA